MGSPGAQGEAWMDEVPPDRGVFAELLGVVRTVRHQAVYSALGAAMTAVNEEYLHAGQGPDSRIPLPRQLHGRWSVKNGLWVVGNPQDEDGASPPRLELTSWSTVTQNYLLRGLTVVFVHPDYGGNGRAALRRKYDVPDKGAPELVYEAPLPVGQTQKFTKFVSSLLRK